MKRKYYQPNIEIVIFMSSMAITDSGDYEGVNFEELI